MTDIAIVLMPCSGFVFGLLLGRMSARRSHPERVDPVVSREELEAMFKPKYRRDSKGRFARRAG